MPTVDIEEFWPTSMFMYIIFVSDEYISIKHFVSMIDLFLVYCHVKHYFKKE